LTRNVVSKPVEPTPGIAGLVSAADPITTEVIRHQLHSAAGQMRRVVMRTAFSPVVYEVLDFAVGVYDHDAALLAQAPSLPMFLGAMDNCIRSAVDAIGGHEELEPGDILVYNIPYGSGAHPQDSAFIMPAFAEGDLVGFAGLKGHVGDLGGKDIYSTDTVDVFQEGLLLPGLKLFQAGERNEDVWRILLANSRAPRTISGDINAWVGAVRTGAAALERIVEKHGLQVFRDAVGRMFDHSEARVRRFIEAIPDGSYIGHCRIDQDAAATAELDFDFTIEIKGSEIEIDLTSAPPQQPIPINSPRPQTVAMARIAIASLAGAAETPDEGDFRPLTVKTREGSLVHPVAPAPSFTYWVGSLQMIEAIHQALAPMLPELVPAESGGDYLVWVWWGYDRMPYQEREHGEPWIDGGPIPIGQGAQARSDGANALMHIAESATRIATAEVWEAKQPWLVEKMELAPDSCGPGTFQGGLGVDLKVRVLRDCYYTRCVERAQSPPRGLAGAGEARPNRVLVRHPDGRVSEETKATGTFVAADSVWETYSGGGGGVGDPKERAVSAIEADLADGYITPAFAKTWYPQYKSRAGRARATAKAQAEISEEGVPA
jgi:N-methylhydantoinase B